METTVKQHVVPAEQVPTAVAGIYWRSLEDAGLLGLRLCDMTVPTVDDAVGMYKIPNQRVYYIYDEDSESLTSEFTLNGFTGKSAQVHFSMHPSNLPQYSMMLARTITDRVLNEWTDKDGNPYLLSLYGLTPVSNRAACAFVRRVGFKKMGILPGGQWYNGEIDDAMVTLKVRNGHGR